MLQKFKTLISILGIIALFLTTFSAVSFADHGEREYRRGDRSGHYDNRFNNRDSHYRGDRDRDRDDDDDDDDVTAPTPSPLPPVVQPSPEPTPPVVQPTPEPTPPAIDGSATYDTYCARCHGQANKGRNIPSSHLSDPDRAGNLSQGQIDAINAL